MSSDSFERFYLQRVAVAEACGCAEAVIRLRDLHPRAAGRRDHPASRPSRHRPFIAVLKHVFNR